MQVTGNKAIVIEAATAVASEDVNRVTGLNLPLGGTWYYGANFKVDDMRTVPGTGSIFDSYFMHLKESGTSAFRGRLWVLAGSTPATYTLGVSASSFNTTGTDIGGQIVSWGSDLTFGTQYTAMVSYTADDNDGDMTDADGDTHLWINPVNEMSTNVLDTMPHPNIYPRTTPFVDVSDLNHPMQSLALRQGGNGPTKATIDIVSIGDSFSEVLAAVAPAPANNSDFNNDGLVDGADFLIFQRGVGLTGQTGKTNGNANSDTVVDGADLAIFQARYGGAPQTAVAAAVAEPAGGLIAILGGTCVALLSRTGPRLRRNRSV